MKYSVNRGFTLIEMLVAMGLLALITGFGAVKYNMTSKAQTVDAAADKLRQTFQTAKSNALAGRKDCSAAVCDCGNDSGNKPLDGWIVYVTSPGTVTLAGSCSGTEFNNHTETLTSDLTISPTGRYKVTYLPLNGGATIKKRIGPSWVNYNATTTFTISSLSISRSKSVIVNLLGGIQ